MIHEIHGKQNAQSWILDEPSLYYNAAAGMSSIGSLGARVFESASQGGGRETCLRRDSPGFGDSCSSPVPKAEAKDVFLDKRGVKSFGSL